MHTVNIDLWKHSHVFQRDSSHGERGTRRVLMLTAAMMIVEILAGLKFRSMALLADGWHMATHVAAFTIAAGAYWFARRHANNERFSFGTGKIGVLGGYTSAIVLGGIALAMAGESVWRIFSPLTIAFNQAIPIACLGLAVNVISALLLKQHNHDGHHHHHDRGAHHSHAHDLNLRAAYLHVLADAMTSVFAILALTCGKLFGWIWLDPVMGIVGSGVIAQWAYALVRDTNVILLDREPAASDLSAEICNVIESENETRICDLHIWQVGVNQFAAIISVVTHRPRPPQFYKDLLREHTELAHITVEVNAYTED